jgi:hypothetical protein
LRIDFALWTRVDILLRATFELRALQKNQIAGFCGYHCFRHRDFFCFGFKILRVDFALRAWVDFPLWALLELRALQKYQIAIGCVRVRVTRIFSHRKQTLIAAGTGTWYAHLLQTKGFFLAPV